VMIFSQVTDRRNRRIALLITIIAFTLANLAFFLPVPFFARLAGGVILFCFLPGFVLLPSLFPERDSLDFLEAFVLSGGLSYALSILIMFGVHLWPGEMTLWQLLLGLDGLILILLIFCFILRRFPLACWSPGRFDQRSLLQVVLLIFLALFFQFTSLGYAEFQGDEIGVVMPARDAIVGQDDALFLQRKGPTQYLIAAAFALFTNGFNEFAIRTPFALASLLTMVALLVMGRTMFDERAGIIAGALLLIDGFSAAHARTVQYQYIVLLMITLTVYCAHRFLVAQDERTSGKFFGIGMCFFALGLLTHYDAILVLPALCLAYLRRNGLRWPPKSRLPTMIGAMVALIVLASFYVPFVLNPHFASTYQMYTQKKVGIGPFNNLPKYVATCIFYNSTYYVAFMTILSVGVWIMALGQALRSRYLVYLVSGLCVVGLLVSTFFPAALSLSGRDYSVLFFLPVVLIFTFSGRIEAALQLILIWFFFFFISKAFVERAPGLHYYGFSPAWALIAAVGLVRLLDTHIFAAWVLPESAFSIHRIYRFGVFVSLMLIYGILAYYHYILFIQHDPEYALQFPRYKHPIYWTPQEQRPDAPFFGFPHKAGWKTIGYLYASGLLRGDYETNSRFPPPRWYVREIPRSPDIPRYLFFDEESALVAPIAKYSKDAIEHFYTQVGEVLVGGQPRLLIYEDERLVTEPVLIHQYYAEDYEPDYDRLFTLNAHRLLARYSDEADRDFKSVANYLQVAAFKNDALILESPEQVGLLSYYYQGDLLFQPLQSALLRFPGSIGMSGEGEEKLTSILEKHSRVYVLWQIPEESASRLQVLDWFANHSSEMGHHQFGSIGLALYAAPERLLPTEPVQYLCAATLGDNVALLGYQLDETALSPGGHLKLTLFWQALASMTDDYTVFTHLIDKQGIIWEQKDNPPVDGLYPTSRWEEGEIMRDQYNLVISPDTPPGKYQIEVGMYLLETGERLEARGEEGPLPENRILLSSPVRIR